MLSTSRLKQNDDPHDVLVVAPDVALAVPTDEELSKLAHSFRHPSAPQIRTGSESRTQSEIRTGSSEIRTGPEIRTGSEVRIGSEPPAGATIPPIDPVSRPSVGAVRWAGPRRAARVFTVGLLLAGCAAAADFGWQSYGDVARQTIAQWTPQRILTSLLSLKESTFSAQPTAPAAAETVATNAASPQPVAPVQAAAQPEAPAEAAAQPAVPAEAAVQPTAPAQPTPQGIAPSAADPSAGSAPSLSTMAHDLANAGQEIEQLKASIEQLKGSIEQLSAGQQQMSRDIAKASEQKKVSEQNVRPKIVPPPHRQAVARRLPPPSRPQPTFAPMSTQAAAPYVPRQPEPPPQDMGEPPLDPELASVPRPPMPLR